MSKKLINMISPCYNEELNVVELYRRVCAVMEGLNDYEFEYVFIDNASTDRTVANLRDIAAGDHRVKVIVNNRNFGHIRSPYWGILQTRGEATIYLASDLQDPPEMIPELLRGWEEGYKVVMAVKPVSECNWLTHFARRSYYYLLDKISGIPLTSHTTGFGLYDAQVIEQLRKINDPYPYLRGLIDELGYLMKTIQFVQPRRIRGVTKNNFYTLYDAAMLGIVSHSMVPLRVASFLGIITGGLSIIAALGVLMAKMIWWDRFAAGLAPIGILLFFILGLVLTSIGLLGEYVGAIHTYIKNRPIVVERERINFDGQ